MLHRGMAGLTSSESGFNNGTDDLDFYDDFSENTNVSTEQFLFDAENFSVGSYGYTRHVLWTVVAPIIIISGTVGNLLTILVFLRSGLKRSSTAIYLSTLALSDTVLLWSAPFGTWLRYAWSVDMQALGDVACRTRLFASSTCLHFSSWILVAVTMERTISVVVPHKAKIYCSPKIAGIVIAVIFVLLIGCDLAVLLLGSVKGYTLFNESKELHCAATTFQEALVHSNHNIIGWVDLLVSYTVPFVFLLAGNTAIIREIHRCRKTQTTLRITRGSRGGSRTSRSRHKSTWSLTVLMVILCVVFLLTMTPVTVFHVYCPMHYNKILELLKTDVESAWDSYQYLLLQRTIVNLVSYTNASFNVILYVLSGSKFREQLKDMCCCHGNTRHVSDRSVFSVISKDTSSSGGNVKSFFATRTKSMATFQQTSKWKEEFLIKRGSQQKDAIEQSHTAFIDDYGSSISSILSTAQETCSDVVNETLDSTIEPTQANEVDFCSQTPDIHHEAAMYANQKSQELSGFLLWI